jgi:type I restriction enzyme S subunit
MSSKTKTTAKKEAATPALVPKLRFPEFRHEVGWAECQLSEITTAIFDGTHQTPTYTDEGVPFYSVENLVSGNANKFISKADYELATKKNKPEKDDVLITRIGKIGYSQVVTWSHDFSIYVTLAVIKKDERFNSQFLHQFIQSALYQKEIFSKSLLSAVPCKINMDSLRATHVLLASPAEQQKIAECLSSVDELMAAQARKVDALKTHKKGLMQQLFPREGETQPRLRFPEFQNAGEWLAKTLDAVAPLQRGFDLPSDEIRPGSVPIVYSNGPKGFHERGMAKGPGLVTGRSGTIGKLHFIESGDYWPHNTSLWVTSFKGHAPKFVYYLYESIGFLRFASGSGVPTLNRNDAHSYETSVPSDRKEQQRIATCLSSLDALITAETQKHEALKTHKKGLMQQLFPALEEVAG